MKIPSTSWYKGVESELPLNTVSIVQRFGKTTILSGWREGLGF